jgi:hypothetical protein
VKVVIVATASDLRSQALIAISAWSWPRAQPTPITWFPLLQLMARSVRTVAAQFCAVVLHGTIAWQSSATADNRG